jgi:hypothetical protein
MVGSGHVSHFDYVDTESLRRGAGLDFSFITHAASFTVAKPAFGASFFAGTDNFLEQLPTRREECV